VEIRINIDEAASPAELSEKEQQVVAAARKAAGDAYAPYSSFRVGAALLLSSGELVTGNNQENASYPDGLCAERVALFAASSTHPGSAVKLMAVAAMIGDEFLEEPVYPCGSCRQALIETEHRFGRPIRILMYGRNRIHIARSVRDLLPLSFNPDFLK
jgi:cytidine deaminase